MGLFASTLTDFLPKRAIGAFQANVTIEETATDRLSITKHPVQQGASITDHAFMEPAELTIKIAWTDEPSKLVEIYDKFRKMQSDRIPMKVVSGKRSYQNMLVAGITQVNDTVTEKMLNITIDLQEVAITALEVVSVPPREQQANPGKTGKTENAGKKQTGEASKQESEKVRNNSALQAIFG